MTDLVRLMLVSGLSPVLALMFILWVYQLIRKNAGVVDIGWALGLATMAWIYAAIGPGYYWRKVLVVTIITLWALGLSSLLVHRMLHEKQEDKRYQRLRSEWGKHVDLKFLVLFEFEAFLDLILSIPFLIACLNLVPRLHILEIIGAALWVIGLLGETVADEQLRKFKEDPSHKGGICQSGLWRYSRHPNYFFEWTMWVAYFVIALASPWGWTAVVGPVIMLHFLINVTGIPFAEHQALKTKGEAYRLYQKTTSFFVPLPRRKV